MKPAEIAGRLVRMPASTSSIRVWAQANGFEVGDRGRLSVEVREAYVKANPSSPSKAPAKKGAAAKPAAKKAARKAPAKKAAAPKAAPAKRAPVVIPTLEEAAEPASPVVVTKPDPVQTADVLALRVSTLEKQLAGLETRLAVLEQPKRGLRRRTK